MTPGPRVIGYARVSTPEQDPTPQVRALESAGAERVYVDVSTGKTMQERPQLWTALEDVEPGDVLAVWRLDRLGRSLSDLIAQVTTLGERGVEFRSLAEAVDTTSPGGRLIFHVFAAVAEFEHSLIVERTTAGLATAQAQGRLGGRPRVVTPERAAHAVHLREAGHSLAAIAQQLRVSKASVRQMLTLDLTEG